MRPLTSMICGWTAVRHGTYSLRFIVRMSRKKQNLPCYPHPAAVATMGVRMRWVLCAPRIMWGGGTRWALRIEGSAASAAASNVAAGSGGCAYPWGVSGGYVGGRVRSGRGESGRNHGGHGAGCTGGRGGPLPSHNAPSQQGHRSILLEEEQVNYFSGSSNSGDTSVKLVGIEKGTSGTASAGGIVDGYSYFGNEPNPDTEDDNDSPLSRQSEWITKFAKQQTTGYSKERKINTFADALEVEMHVLLGQFPPQHHVILFNSLMLDRRNKKRWKLENIALMCLIYRSTSTIGSKLKSLVALTLLSMPSL